MNAFRFAVILLLCASIAVAQSQDSPTASALQPHSPFGHLLPPMAKTAVPRPFVCTQILYYQNGPGASYAYHTENLPFSSEWVMKVTAPTQATACTVWTISLDFELLNATLFDRDTIRFYVRNASPPYSLIFSTFYIARAGSNTGTYEVDPTPPGAPPAPRAYILPNRDVLVGVKVIGDSSHQVRWRFTTPSLFTTPPRTFKLAGSQLTPASTVVGQSVDFMIEAVFCCDFPIPVELSSFSALVQQDVVALRWRTESETNNFSFELQRGPTALGPWETRAILPGHGTTTQAQEYEHRDPIGMQDLAGAAPVYWYRLLQHDYDGKTNVIPAIQVHLADLATLGFELSPVYPNPLVSASDVARIRYRVPAEQPVRVTVHDMLGRTVAVLADYPHAAGVYEASWTPNSVEGPLGSGTYIVRLQSGNAVMTRSVALAR